MLVLAAAQGAVPPPCLDALQLLFACTQLLPAQAASLCPCPRQVLFRVRVAATRQALAALQQPCKVLVRLANHPRAFRTISSIKADSIGRLVSVRGTVVRATPAQPLVTEMEFVCGKCGAPQRATFPDGRFTPPAACGEGGCRSRTFAPNKGVSVCIDWQRVGLQVRRHGGGCGAELGCWTVRGQLLASEHSLLLDAGRHASEHCRASHAVCWQAGLPCVARPGACSPPGLFSLAPTPFTPLLAAPPLAPPPRACPRTRREAWGACLCP